MPSYEERKAVKKTRKHHLQKHNLEEHLLADHVKLSLPSGRKHKIKFQKWISYSATTFQINKRLYVS